MTAINIADQIARQLEQRIQDTPDGFYDSFQFTKTGNNLTHPWTWGILTRILWDLPEIMRVGVDVRLNSGSEKFQPDLVGYSANDQPIIFLDYESPNSSDARIPIKDIDPYLFWRGNCNSEVPYVIVTTLPEYPSPNWELRYTSAGKYNHDFRDKRELLRKNPCQFWYEFYLTEFGKRQISGVSMINISRKSVERKYPVSTLDP